MAFNSLVFVLFFATVYPAYLALRTRLRAQNTLLLVASLFFYGSWDARFLLLLGISAGVDFAAGRALMAVPAERAPLRKRILFVSLAVNLGILAVFKYAGFFADSAAALLNSLGMKADIPTLNMILPLGISFYTFQSMSYTIDVYRGHVAACRRIDDFFLYVTFFPQLVAGPIERTENLMRQLQTPRRVTGSAVNAAIWLILWGYFKKVVVADNLAASVDQAFGASTGAAWSGLIAFGFQIYGDFSGYSDIARGLALLMGIELMPNFRLPYFAASPREFWHRWHVSLSTWLRDYLYIPLGGGRGGEAATYRNLMLTMLLGGLWHGAGWTFIVWGGYHGMLLCADRFVRSIWRGPAATPWLRVPVQFVLAMAGWAFFRGNTLADALRILTSPDLSGIGNVAALVAPIMIVEAWQYRTGDAFITARLPAAVRIPLYAGILLAILILGARVSPEFIYFQF